MTRVEFGSVVEQDCRVHVGQGEFEVTDRHDLVFSTILGSCVSACIRDPSLGIGGMNHFLLPEAPGSGPDDRRYGVQAMELLVNALLAFGANRYRLEAKVFGGGRMSAGLVDIGSKNVAFVRQFLVDEGIPIVGESLGGLQARRIHYWPATGRAKQQLVADPTLAEREKAIAATTARGAVGDLELF